MSRTKKSKNIHLKKGFYVFGERRMRPYTLPIFLGKYELQSYEEQKQSGKYPTKKTRNKKDVIKAANRSKKKAYRQYLKKLLKEEL